MLKKSDVSIDRFLPSFAVTGIPVAFLVPTATGYEKSIMDATAPVRELLKSSNIHNYDAQLQGQEHKHIVRAWFVSHNMLIETSASLYRPMTKKGDPRIWFSNLKQYCNPYNLLALVVIKDEIYVFNLSHPLVSRSLLSNGFAMEILKEYSYQNNLIANELLAKIREVHNRGFIPSITSGDPGVGDTLENALGIRRNNSTAPDYKGIELKASRLTRGGTKRSNTRVNLFSKVPDYGKSYSEIVQAYGRWKYVESKNEDRLSIENTLLVSHPNSFNLILDVDVDKDRLNICHVENGDKNKYVSHWMISNLRKQLLIKHRETFWVKAQSIYVDGVEWFRYDKVLRTRNPNDSLFAPLVETDKITVDLLGYFTKQKNMKWRDHGMLFKIHPNDLHLLFGEPIEYDLTK